MIYTSSIYGAGINDAYKRYSETYIGGAPFDGALFKCHTLRILTVSTKEIIII